MTSFQMVPWKPLVLITAFGTVGYISLYLNLYGNYSNGRLVYSGDLDTSTVEKSVLDVRRQQHYDAGWLVDQRVVQDALWIPVSNTRCLFVYSAFYDYSLPDRIRVIGVMPSFHRVRAWCLLTTGNSTVRIMADMVNINEEHHKRYTTAYFLCYLSESSNVPDTVSIVEDGQSPTHSLHINAIPTAAPNSTHLHNFTVCLSPFNNRYNNTNQLLEWIEMNRLFGVTHFTFYNFSASPYVQDIIQYYARLGLADVLQWNIDTIDKDMLGSHDGPLQAIHYYGQLAAINDCLYRNKRLTNRLAIVDVDEYIVPRNHQHYTWTDMFTCLPDASVYMFRNAFFHLACGPLTMICSNRSSLKGRLLTEDMAFNQSDSNRRSIKEAMVFNRSVSKGSSLNKNKLSNKQLLRGRSLNAMNAIYREETNAEGERSKLIVKASEVVTLGIHEVWSIKSSSSRVHAVPPLIGLLHHYRTDPLHALNTSELIEDRTIHKYGTLEQTIDTVIRNMDDKGYEFG